MTFVPMDGVVTPGIVVRRFLRERSDCPGSGVFDCVDNVCILFLNVLRFGLPNGSCVAGVCLVEPPECSVDADRNGTCELGVCIGGLGDTECSNERCVNFECRLVIVCLRLSIGQICEDSFCQAVSSCVNDSQCGPSKTCVAGSCEEVTTRVPK